MGPLMMVIVVEEEEDKDEEDGKEENQERKSRSWHYLKSTRARTSCLRRDLNPCHLRPVPETGALDHSAT